MLDPEYKEQGRKYLLLCDRCQQPRNYERPHGAGRLHP